MVRRSAVIARESAYAEATAGQVTRIARIFVAQISPAGAGQSAMTGFSFDWQRARLNRGLRELRGWDRVVQNLF